MNEMIGFEDIKLAILEVWNKKVIALASGIMFFLIGILVTLNMSSTDTYRAVATVYSAVFGSYEESVDAASAMLRYSGVVSSAKVCERAASIVGDNDIDTKDIQRMISVTTSSSSVVMSISAVSADKALAQKVANAVAEAFVIEIRTITGSDAIQMLDRATESKLYYDGSSKITKYRVLAAVAGVGMVVAFVFVTTLFSNKVRSLKQLEDMDESIIAIIPKVEK